MKTLLTCALLAMFGAAVVGCEASGSVGTDSSGNPKHEEVKEKTVTDSNGNVISHEKESHTTDNNP